jgi:protein-S-isoprenylcysteine O-methyltransferase Ste14
MRRFTAVLGSVLFFAVPCTVAGWVPWWISRWQFQHPFFGFMPFRIVGAILILAGIPPLLDSFVRFALEGVGTPAPVFPTKQLVVSGWYRYVRNPMYVAVASLIFGQALLFANVTVAEYGAIVWLFFHLFVLLYEEPTLRATYGEQYDRFRANVPRWIPRLTPWRSQSL